MKIVLTLLILAAIPALSYGANYSDSGPNHPINVKHRQSYVNSMDKTMNPCWDFYQYSCGNWWDHHRPIHRNKYTSVLELLSYEVNLELIEYMASTHMDDKPDFVKNAYEFYASCRSASGFKGVMKVLEEHDNMKWILRMKTVDKTDKFDWAHTLGLMRVYGVNEIFVKERVYVKETDPSVVIVELSNPNPFYGYDYSLEYAMKQLNDAIELSEDVTNIGEFFKEFNEFVDILDNLGKIKDESKQVMKVKDLQFSWLRKYLSVILDDESLDANMEITINNISYMEALDNILKYYDDEFLQRYLEVRFLIDVRDSISTIVNDELRCIESLRGLMPLAMHWIYEQMHPELEQEIPKIHHMFDNILKYVNKTLRSDKIDLVPHTFLTKLDKMQLKVGNIPRQDTINALDAFYANLSLTHTDYFGNYLQLMRFRFNIEHFLTTNDVLNKFNEYFDKNENYDLRNNVIPRYEPVDNVLIVPSYLLRPPIYHWAYGDLFKQSSLGAIMAHYVYSAMPKDDFSEEDVMRIVGMGGVHTAYEMFFSTFVPENMREYQPIVDVIDVPLKQMFFVNAAQYYCKYQGNTDRVNLVMKALPEFVEAFNCKNMQFRKIFKN